MVLKFYPWDFFRHKDWLRYVILNPSAYPRRPQRKRHPRSRRFLFHP